MSPSSQNVHELIPGTHKYFIRQGKRDCTDVNKLRDLRWGDYPSEPNIKKKGPYERDYPSEPNEKKKGVLMRERHKGLSHRRRCYDVSRSQGEAGPGIKKCRVAKRNEPLLAHFRHLTSGTGR